MNYSAVSKTIREFNYETASPNDVAILLEQVFLYHDDRCRDGGPLLVAQGVLRKFEESVRRRAAPELHEKMSGRCGELRSTVVQLEELLRKLEKDSAQTRT